MGKPTGFMEFERVSEGYAPVEKRLKNYREFVAHAAEDPTGYATLQRVLGTPDMDAFAKQWAAFTLQLKFP